MSESSVFTAFLTEQAQRTQVLQRQLQQIFDPFGLLATTRTAQQAWANHPFELADNLHRYAMDGFQLQAALLRRFAGEADVDLVEPQPDDPRFSDPIWSESPFWDSVKEYYLFQTRWMQNSLYATPGLTEGERRKSAFWLRQLLNALAPNNFLLGNPTALNKAITTQGESLWQGWDHFARDVRAGDIAMTDLSAFTVGENLATTPGVVVYRNELLEVIHYQSNTPTVHQTPIVLISPWINKYYILDLNPAKSMVKYLVDQGFSVFVTSWKNPDATMAEVGLDDYLTQGIVPMIQVAKEISGSEQVNLVGYCIGGTLVSLYMAWINRLSPAAVPVSSVTLLTTLTDFSCPGDIEVFIDEDGLDAIDAIMERQGYLDGKDMAASFRMLRSNSLIWQYWQSNYLLGEPSTAFDILYWNMDSTRMPKKMHHTYLRELYWHNRMIEPDGLHLAGQGIDLARITQPIYMVSAEEDHIAPWQQTFTLAHRVSAPVRLTLSTSGHIVGIINPPSPQSKRSFRQIAFDQNQNIPAALGQQAPVAGSWWPNWVDWLRGFAGAQIKPKLTSRQHPNLGAAPGTYVLE